MKDAPTLPLPAAKQARSRARMDQIIAAGLDLLKEYSFEALTMEQIAERAGCTVGTLYKRFANKEALLKVLAEAVRQDVLQDFDGGDRAVWLNGDSLDEIVRVLVGAIVNTVREREGLIQALSLLQLQRPGSLRTLQEGNAAVVALAVARSERFCPAHLDPATFERRFRVAYQMMIGTLVNCIVNEPGPLDLHDGNIKAELVAAILAQLQAP